MDHLFAFLFLSAVLDNLTSAIVMVSLIRKIIDEKETRLIFCGMIVIAANAGGAWSPIGDVTTTMLWIGGQITPFQIMANLLLPSIVCLLVPLIIMSARLKGNLRQSNLAKMKNVKAEIYERDKSIVFISGILILLFVPIFKTVTHLPPFMGMLFGLGMMWIITEIIHAGKDTQDKNFLSVMYALRKIDTPSILFFLGILISVAALHSIGALGSAARGLDTYIGNETVIVSFIGVFSSIVDNVPLVAAVMNMYTLEQFPVNHSFWQFLAYCAGTGGSILLIGSAAGVAAMGIEKIEFFWYLKKISWLAITGYVAGSVVFLVQQLLFSY